MLSDVNDQLLALSNYSALDAHSVAAALHGSPFRGHMQEFFHAVTARVVVSVEKKIKGNELRAGVRREAPASFPGFRFRFAGPPARRVCGASFQPWASAATRL